MLDQVGQQQELPNISVIICCVTYMSIQVSLLLLSAEALGGRFFPCRSHGCGHSSHLDDDPSSEQEIQQCLGYVILKAIAH